jgi:NAD(P)H-dependent flavin oxidoreductase YrpB (nitropropane dioxygenase family)
MLKTPLCDLLGTDVSIILAPMGSATSAEFAAAVSNNETLLTAGQTAGGGIKEILPVADIMRQLIAETEAALARKP